MSRTHERVCRICGTIWFDGSRDQRLCPLDSKYGFLCHRENQRRCRAARKDIDYVNQLRNAREQQRDRNWTPDMDHDLFDRLEAGETIEAIARDVNRRVEDVRERAEIVIGRGREWIDQDWQQWCLERETEGRRWA